MDPLRPTADKGTQAPSSALTDPTGNVRPRVLLVDDDAQMRSALGELLASDGMEVVDLLEDGAEVLKAVGRLCPHVVVTDVRMPVVDGLEVTRRLRRSHPRTPVVIHTGDDSRVVAELAEQAGAVAVIGKGDPPQTLVDTVRRAAAGVWGRIEERPMRPDPDDLDTLFRPRDLFPPGQRPNRFQTHADPPSATGTRPFGLRFAVPTDPGARQLFDQTPEEP